MAAVSDIFDLDLIVTTDGGTEWLLIVDVKLRVVDLTATESQLKQYMLGMRCPCGLLATPDKLRIYYDRFLSATEDSIERVGEFAAPREWSSWRSTPDSERAALGFEDTVRNWLEGLGADSELRSVPVEFRDAAERYLLPVLNHGVLRAAGPRSM
jgi:hypothetical protein